MAADEQMDDAGGVALDVEAISAKYRGIAKIKRLQHIATHSKADQKRAVELSIDAIKADTCDTDAYKLLHQTYASILGPAYSYDGTWVERTEVRAATRRAAIEKDLQMQMSNQIRENLRRSHMDMGSFLMERGEYNNAIRSYMRAKEYCANSRQIAENCLSIVELAIFTREWSAYGNNLTRTEVLTEASASPNSIGGRVSALLGLQALLQGTYSSLASAARHFLAVPATIGDTFAHVVHVEEVSQYAVLCALASFSREELKNEVLASGNAKQLLEYQPLLREIVQDMVSSRYASALESLGKMRSDLFLDLHLGPLIGSILKQIRSKALTQYLVPYTAVDLRSMAASFRMDVAELRAEIADLIMSKAVSGRIDCLSNKFSRFQVDARTVSIDNLQKSGQQFVSETRALLLQASMKKHGIVVREARGAGNTAAAASAASAPVRPAAAAAGAGGSIGGAGRGSARGSRRILPGLASASAAAAAPMGAAANGDAGAGMEVDGDGGGGTGAATADAGGASDAIAVGPAGGGGAEFDLQGEDDNLSYGSAPDSIGEDMAGYIGGAAVDADLLDDFDYNGPAGSAGQASAAEALAGVGAGAASSSAAASSAAATPSRASSLQQHQRQPAPAAAASAQGTAPGGGDGGHAPMDI